MIGTLTKGMMENSKRKKEGSKSNLSKKKKKVLR